jgi:hypothetical protein
LELTLTIPKKIPNRDLLFLIKGIGPASDPDLYITSKTNQATMDPLTAEYYCNANGEDVCVIPAKEVKETTYHLMVECIYHCRFQLKAIYEEELSMGPNDLIRLNFKEDKAMVVVVAVPTLPTDMDYMEIEARVLDPTKLEEPFQMMLSRGNKIPQSNKYDYLGQDVWTGSKIVVLKTKDSLEEGNYTLLIEAPEGCTIDIITKLYGNIRDIQIFDEIKDTVLAGDVRFYRLNLTDNKALNELFIQNDISFVLTPYSGNPDMYLNHNSQPPVLNSYKWSTFEESIESILISDTEKKSIKTEEDNIFYIAVYGKTAATYTLTVIPEMSG